MNQNDKIKDIKDIDDIIYIKILDRNIDSDLYDIIIINIIHDLYDSKYMINEKYLKKYSYKFYNEMISNKKNYLIY